MIIWIFDINCRVYPKDKPGQTLGFGQGPIWREHWREHKVVSETSRSWVTSRGHKISKKDPGPWVCFGQTELDDLCFVQENRFRVAEIVQSKANAAQMRAIIEILRK